MSEQKKSAFEQAGSKTEGSLFGELMAMMRQNKKYWLIPLVVLLLIFGVLLVLGTTAAAPFIYTLF